MTRGKAPTTRSNAKKGFSFLFLTAWVCAGALVKWDARGIYLLLGITVIAGLWMGRRQPALLRLLLLLALVFPIWKTIDRWPNGGVAGGNAPVTRGNAPSIGDDAGVIGALVTAEERYLTLSPKMSALSKGLLNFGLPGPEREAEGVSRTSVWVSQFG